MKNREKFREQILEWAVAPWKDLCDFKREEVFAHFGKKAVMTFHVLGVQSY